jgi:hypothetical protein
MLLSRLRLCLESRTIERLNLTADFVLEGILRLAKKGESNAEFTSALRAHELLGKYYRLKMWREVEEQSGPNGGPIAVTVDRGL